MEFGRSDQCLAGDRIEHVAFDRARFRSDVQHFGGSRIHLAQFHHVLFEVLAEIERDTGRIFADDFRGLQGETAWPMDAHGAGAVISGSARAGPHVFKFACVMRRYPSAGDSSLVFIENRDAD